MKNIATSIHIVKLSEDAILVILGQSWTWKIPTARILQTIRMLSCGLRGQLALQSGGRRLTHRGGVELGR